MLVRDWMTKEVITLEEDESILKAIQILKEYQFRRLPITKYGKLIGIITDKDIKVFLPSKMITCDFKEFFDSLSEVKVRHIMTKNPLRVKPTDTISYASVLMLENRVSGLPVVNEENYVVGIITQTDIFKLLISITGTYHSPYQIGLEINSLSEFKKVLEIFSKYSATVISFLTWKEDSFLENQAKIKIFIRFQLKEEKVLNELLKVLEENFILLYFVKDDLKNLPRRYDLRDEIAFISY
ncbi:MAG: CBS domain-containing protein [Thermodesulfobacteriaceae bacterium]|nr:CBS domain-containing protein [Thermodesulfobacteriaceae bacterium]MDW8136279.1 CBS domain-containing protein [Thermodesulfobacterium sp.]